MKTKREKIDKNFCEICEKDIKGGSYNFKAHMYRHKIVEPRYKCSFCGKQYFRKDVYHKHLSVHTGNQKTFVCDYCDRNFVDKRNLASHLRIHDDSLAHVQQFTCIACGISYCEERLLKYHIRKEHFNLQPKVETVSKKLVNQTWIERVKESDICVQMTKVNNNVIAIKKCATIKNENNDEDLDKNSKFAEYMKSVFAIEDTSQYSKAVCDYCNKEMLKKSLQSHIRERHLKLRRFKCEECKEQFARHYQLVNHICGQFRRRRVKK